MSLAQKLCEVMAAVERIPKRGWNDFYKYHYATEADVAEALRVELAKRNIFLLPSIKEITERDVTTKRGAAETITRVTIECTFIDAETGDKMTYIAAGCGQDSGDKGIYKAITGAMKYALLKPFLVPTGDDPEADIAVDARVAEVPPQAAEIELAAAPAEPGEKAARSSWEPATQKQLNLIWKLAREQGLNPDQIKILLGERFGITSSKELTKADASEFIEWLLAEGQKRTKPEEVPF